MPPRKRQEPVDPKLLDYIRSEQRKWAGVGVGVEAEPAEKPSQAARIDGLRLSAIELAERMVAKAKRTDDARDVDAAQKAIASALEVNGAVTPKQAAARVRMLIEHAGVPSGDSSDEVLEFDGPPDDGGVDVEIRPESAEAGVEAH